MQLSPGKESSAEITFSSGSGSSLHGSIEKNPCLNTKALRNVVARKRFGEELSVITCRYLFIFYLNGPVFRFLRYDIGLKSSKFLKELHSHTESQLSAWR